MIKNKPKKPQFAKLIDVDGSEHRRKIPYICRPKWDFEDPIEEDVWEFGIEDALLPEESIRIV